MSDNEYGYTEDDAAGGGGGSTAKPIGTYTGEISRAEVKKDTNGKLYLKFGVAITLGKYKKQLIFENYLPLASTVNAYQKARRNSFYKAIGLKAGEIPYGVPNANGVVQRDASLLNGTIVDVSIEHEFEEVPGEQYSVTTSKSAKSNWKKDGWENSRNDKGQLVRSPGGTQYDAPIDPRETVTFYNLSDEFEGVGGGDAAPDEPSDEEVPWG